MEYHYQPVYIMRLPVFRVNMRRRIGAAYIEFLIAVAVTTIGSAGVLGLVVASQQASKCNEYFTIASQIARTEIETIRSTRADKLANRTDASFLSVPTNLDDLPEGEATVTITDSTVLTGAKDVTVTVSWVQPPPALNKSITLKTMVAPNVD